MITDPVAIAARSIKTLSVRDGVSEDAIREYIREAIAESYKDLSPQAELLWKSMTAEGNMPSPEELIAWAAGLCTATARSKLGLFEKACTKVP